MSAAKLRITPLFALFLWLGTCALAPSCSSRLLAQGVGTDLYDLGQIVEIELEMHDPHWKKKLNAWKKNNLKERVLATLRVNGEVFDSVGVRLKGNSSYFAPVRAEKKKLPFNIKVSYTHKKQRVQGKYRTLKLSNVFRDPSYLRESLSYAIARDYVSAPDCNYARLTVDGDYYGLYNLTESVDEQFWEDEFKVEDGLLFKCDPESKDPPPAVCPPGLGANLSYLGADSACYLARYELKKADAGWKELIGMTMALENEKIKPESWLNVDETLWMLAFNNALVNLDSYLGAFCHNYYLFRDSNGIWRPVIWDLNLSVGGFRLVTQNKILTNEELVKLSPFLHFSDRNEDRPLILRLFDRPLFRKMYVAHLRTIYEEQFAENQYLKRAEAIRETITPEVIQEPNPLYPTETYTQNYHNTVEISGGAVIGLQEFFEQRGEYLRDHPLFRQPVPEIAAHQALEDGNLVAVSVTLASGVPAEAVWVAHRPEGASNFRYTKLAPEADGNYATQLDADAIKDYFLVAEGRISATVLPARSAREWFRVEQVK
jgi:hypothetical protein